MSSITIKQNKKGTFLDLTELDFRSEDFVSKFQDFNTQTSGFLSGSSVCLIFPSDIDLNSIGGDSREIIARVKAELNNSNISVKSLMKADSSEIHSVRAPELQELSKDHEEKELVDTSSLPETLYVESNLRSGQLIRYPGNVFVLGDVNPSAEIIAAGDVIIWGTLRGIVHAGANDDNEAKIIVMNLKGGQLRIASKIQSINFDPKHNSGFDFKKLLGVNKEPTSINLVIVKVVNNELVIKEYF